MESVSNFLQLVTERGVGSFERKNRDFNFSTSYPYLEKIYKDTSAIENFSIIWNTLTDEKKRLTQRLYQSLVDLLNEIIHFDVSHPNVHDVKRNIDQRLQSEYKIYDDELRSILELEAIRERLTNSTKGRFTSEARKILDELTSAKNEANVALNAIREVTAKTAISKHANVFLEEAEKYSRHSKYWFITAIIFTLMFIILIGVFIWNFDTTIKSLIESDNLNFQNLAQIGIAKLLMVSFCSYVYYQIIRNFNTNKHLEVINRHRTNCMISFDAFINSTDDSGVKDAILLQATRAIFEPGDTGFVMTKDTNIRGLETFNFLDSMKTTKV